jgi:hypothetical protein
VARNAGEPDSRKDAGHAALNREPIAKQAARAANAPAPSLAPEVAVRIGFHGHAVCDIRRAVRIGATAMILHCAEPSPGGTVIMPCFRWLATSRRFIEPRLSFLQCLRSV